MAEVSAANNDFAEMGLDPAAYEALEKDFQEVL
jgi:hypothetical protein